jgi:hypothetical protein
MRDVGLFRRFFSRARTRLGVEDSLNAWEETLKKPGTEENLEAVAGESDSGPDEFFDFNVYRMA